MRFFNRPLQYGAYRVLAAHPVPEHIPRPEFVTNPTFDYALAREELAVHGPESIARMRRAGQLASKALAFTAAQVRPGATTEDLDRACHEFIVSHGAYPTPIGFMGFPKSVCTSVNECLVHGIPDTRPLEEGDSLNIDSCLFLDGVHGDNSLTLPVGRVRA
jgi:methionyl aminopeptidase